MPLPDGAPLSLQVSSNAVQSKPKRAMIVRMSAETLDALEAFPNHPPMSFDFGDKPGIFIGDSFFPMRPQEESSPHELYLRTVSAAKPMAPLKLYANVIGKFMVERQLGDKATDKVRQQTMVAKQQHMERQAILLDQPPIPVPASKRKIPGSITVLKKTLASDQPRLPSSSALPSRKVSPPPQNTPSTKANTDLRRRLVHYLAISSRLADDVVRMVGSASISASARKDLLALLEEVAEQQPPTKKGDKSPRLWALKPQSWTQVRPFEWPKLTEADRVTMARQARMAFKALKIPESDPAWENVRYRPSAPTIPQSVPAPPLMAASNSSRSSTSTQAELKRSAVTSKDSKQKSKQETSRLKGEIQMKDESTKPTVSRVNAIKRAEVERPTTPPDAASGANAVVSRRLPGSGYQAKKSPQLSTDKSGTPVDSRTPPKPSLPTTLPPKPSHSVPPAGGAHSRKTVPSIPPKPLKKEDESDRERDREYERQREREREKREREKEKEKQREEWEREWERVETEKREKARQKEREATEREKRQREKEREREEVEQEKRRKEKERIAKERAASGAPPFKRKTATQDTEATLDDASSKTSVLKRRKLEDGTSVASLKARDAALPVPKKLAREPSPVPRLKIKKEPSPQSSVSNQERRAAVSTTGSTHKSERSSKASGSAKPRRRSPIYTSSEDEGEIPQSRRRDPSPLPISDRSNSSDQPPTERTPRQHFVPRAAYPPSTDHAALRSLYQSQYANYLGTFSKIVAQKRKIEAMLNGDSEAEMDVMDPDDLVKLSMEHKSLKTELESIHEIYTKGTVAVAIGTGGGGGPSLD